MRFHSLGIHVVDPLDHDLPALAITTAHRRWFKASELLRESEERFVSLSDTSIYVATIWKGVQRINLDLGSC